MRIGAVSLSLVLAAGVTFPAVAEAQSSRVRDLTVNEGDVPVSLVGYGLVVGLEGTGDRVYGGDQSGFTVRSIANLLRNLGIDVPERMIRMRNAAAVLVTAEASPYTRRGGRFDVSVASLGDASSLRGGQLWQTPLKISVNGPTLAMAQGNIVIPGASRVRSDGPVETSAVLTDGGIALTALTAGQAGPPARILLKDPDLATAQQIVESINTAIADGTATLEDPGSVALNLPAADGFATLVQIGDLEITPGQEPRVVIDAQSGAVAAGGDISVGAATVAHDWLTLTVAPAPDAAGAPGLPPDPLPPGAVRADAGVRVQALAESLHQVGATADIIGSVFRSLRSVGAIRAEVVIR